MAHQMNLVFGDIFKENEIFKRISKEAIQIVICADLRNWPKLKDLTI